MPPRRNKKNKPSKPDRGARAPQMRDWLDFIKPHLERYVLLPRGEQKKFVERLSEEMREVRIQEGGLPTAPGPSVNTLRRWMAAAQYLESHGIVRFEEGKPRVPAAAVEMVSRISKRDPAHAQTLLADLLAGRQTVRRLRTELENMPEDGLSPDPDVRKISYGELQQALREFAGQLFGKSAAAVEFELTDFELGPRVLPAATFDPLAQPYATGTFSKERRVVVFDESTVRWKVSPDRARREFKRNIAVAAAMFDIVAVCCATLRSDVDDVRGGMYPDCRQRVLVLTGALAPDVGERVSPLRGLNHG
jgi:hypothetical protein